MARKEKFISTTHIVWRREWISLLIVKTVTVCLLLPVSVTAQVDCYYCEGPCDSMIPVQTVTCGAECGAWYLSEGSTIEVFRGCIASAPEGATVYQRCESPLCNAANPVPCLRCQSIFGSDCEDVLCPSAEDQCYLNPADGHRGCTSDASYATDCESEGSCSLCTPENDRSCNANIQCVVCDASVDPVCLQDPDAVESCPSSADQCFRYLDASSVVHLGCTSGLDYQSNCNQPFNCRTCASNECNRNDVFACYTCSNCKSVDEELHTPIECTIFETDRCYTGFDWEGRLTYRGCASQELLPFDAADLCYESGCNRADFPTHLQCYQCAGCEQLVPADTNYCKSDGATGCFMLLAESALGEKTLVRGCNTDNEYGECSEDRNCVTCYDDNCNGGAKTVPIFCTQCTGATDCGQDSIAPSCGDLTFYNRCYMFSDTGEQLVKGCLLDLEPDSELSNACYDTEDQRCQYCTGNNCNQPHCVRCDTRTEDGACILGLESGALRFEMCTSASGCRVLIDAEGHTIRGCVDDIVDPCQGTIDCLRTQLPGSNGEVFPPDRRRCHRCDGGELCYEMQIAGNEQFCPLHFGASDGCYIYNDGSTVVRGCTTDPDSRCLTADDPNCSVWDESLSNGAISMSCYQDCPDSGDGSVPACPPSMCSAPNNLCFLSVSSTGVISRGCTTNFERCPGDSKDCYLCAEPNCNGVVRSICASCDTQEEPDCSVAEEHGVVCDGTGGCFHYANIDRQIYGCAECAPELCTDDEDHCQFCDGPFCNAKALAFCYTCTNCPDVHSPVVQATKICDAEGDYCFTGLDGSRIDRGCLSEMPQPIELYQQIQNCNDRLLCNSLSRLEWISCYVCTDCPTQPSSDASELCVSPPTDRCYTIRDTEGLVRRGCATDDVLRDCGKLLICDVCPGDDCNNRNVPASSAFSCVRCDGDGCSEYNVVSVCPNEKGLLFDGCVTYDDGMGNVQKGCLSDETLSELCSAGESADERCSISSEPNGNARRISCYTCNDETECVEEQFNVSTAPSYEHGSCVVFIAEDGTIVRGSSLLHGSCTDNQAQHCFECASDGCNGVLFPPNRLYCYQCSGEECSQLTPGGTIVPQLCPKYDDSKPECYTWFEDEFNVERGCHSDGEVCHRPGVSCQLCANQNGCNDKDYHSLHETKTCIKCSSNLDCETNPAEEICSESLGCYTYFSGLFVVAKGCVSELNPSSSWYDDCFLAGGSERCLRCAGDNCNENRCFVCHSRDEGGCLEPRTSVDGSASCPTQECVAFIDDAGYTVRGCATDYTEAMTDCSDASELCLRCEGDHCNGGPLPKERLKCFQCSGSAAECLSPAKGSEKYCQIYPKAGAESCYTYFADENTVERGCVAERQNDCEGHCQQCSTAACNNQPAIAKNSQRCVQCTGDEDCSADGSTLGKPCSEEVLFGRTDRCYTFFQSGVVIQRGCVSQLTIVEAAPCRDSGDASCKLCSPNDCNAASVHCIVCDSDTQPLCAGEMSSETPSPFQRQCGTGKCVSMVSEGITKKGCAEDFELECASGANGVLCKVFEGTLSNSGAFPEDRLQCYKCQGHWDACGQIGAGTPLEPCQRYNPSDECYTYVADNGETIRGCLSDPEGSAQCTGQHLHCVRCSGQGCNTAASEQPNWLTCAKCSRAIDCNQPGKGSVFDRCQGTVLLGRHDSCYTYSYGGETLERGCLSEADPVIHTHCPEGSSSQCSVCHCDRCNGPPVKCAVCVGQTGCGDEQGAAGRFEDCRTGSCVTFAQQLANGSTVIVKGCSEDHDADTCIAGPEGGVASYQLCQTSQCNDIRYPAGRVRCYQCEGDACADRSLQPTICDPYDVSQDSCYSFLDRQQKGCLGQLSDDQLETCLEEEGKLCKVCLGNGCNVEPRVLECTFCNSKTDPGCAAPMAATTKSTKTCSTGGCVTFIDAGGFTVKGCATDYQLTDASCFTEGFCSLCYDGDACNDALLFPPNRLMCFQCSGAGCSDVSLQNPTVCQRYHPGDACYTYAKAATNVERGCITNRDEPCTAECVICANPNGCNADPVIVPNELSCHHCDGVDCGREQTDQGRACPDSILLGRTDACYSFVETYTVRRGCLSEDNACDPSNSHCHVCTTGSDCNREQYEVTSHECIQCSDDKDEDGEACKWGYSATEAVRCPEGSSPGSGCYSCYNADISGSPPTDGGLDDTSPALFRRGCVGDEWQQRCYNATLAVCLGSACNNRNERLQICAKCTVDCDGGRWEVEECRGPVPYERRGCYLFRDSRKRILARGCVADLDETDWERCSNARDGSCTTCLENQCNRAPTQAERTSGLAVLALTLLSVSYTLGLRSH